MIACCEGGSKGSSCNIPILQRRAGVSEWSLAWQEEKYFSVGFPLSVPCSCLPRFPLLTNKTRVLAVSRISGRAAPKTLLCDKVEIPPCKKIPPLTVAREI